MTYCFCVKKKCFYVVLFFLKSIGLQSSRAVGKDKYFWNAAFRMNFKGLDVLFLFRHRWGCYKTSTRKNYFQETHRRNRKGKWKRMRERKFFKKRIVSFKIIAFPQCPSQIAAQVAFYSHFCHPHKSKGTIR